MKIEVIPDGKLFIIAGCLNNKGWMEHVSIPFSDFSQTMTKWDDLERFLIDAIERKTR